MSMSINTINNQTFVFDNKKQQPKSRIKSITLTPRKKQALTQNDDYLAFINKINELGHYFSSQNNLTFFICLDIDIPYTLLTMYSKSNLQKTFRAYLHTVISSDFKLVFINYDQLKANQHPTTKAEKNLDQFKINELFNYFYNYMVYNYEIEE